MNDLSITAALVALERLVETAPPCDDTQQRRLVIKDVIRYASECYEKEKAAILPCEILPCAGASEAEPQ